MAQVSYGTITVNDITDINDVYLEYALALSGANVTNNYTFDNLGEISWSTTYPTWQSGYQIWIREVQEKEGVQQKEYKTPYLDTAVNQINNNYIGLDNKLKTFFYPGDSNYAGAFAVGHVDNLNVNNINTYGFNTRIQVGAISMGYNAIPLLEMGLLGNNFNGIKLYSPILSNQNIITGNRLDATLTSEGLKLIRGGIVAGSYNSIASDENQNFVYLSSENYGIGTKIGDSASDKADWRQIIGNKFGVDKAGNLYAAGAHIDGDIIAQSLTIGSGANAYSGIAAINITGYSIEIEVADIVGSTSTKKLIPHLLHNGENADSEVTDKTDFIWYVDNSISGVPGDSVDGSIVGTYGSSYRVIYDFDDGAVGGGTATRTLTVDPSKYITRISDTGITIHPEMLIEQSSWIQLDGNGMELFNSSNESVASYGSTVRIGKLTAAHSIIDANGQRFYASNGTTQLANIGYGIGTAESGTSTAPYYTFGKRRITTSTYNSSSTYELGDMCVYDGKLYVCIQGISTAESWTSSHWSLAIGNYSSAEGFNIIASGSDSHAEGSGTCAIGMHSHAEGWGSLATGLDSHAEGYVTKAIGAGSHAEGFQTTASGTYSHAEGNRTTATDSNSHAEGSNTTASGNNSHAEGYGTNASNGSHAEGFQTTASGTYSHAEGNRTTASGNFSHAEGSQTTANEGGSHAEGSQTTASGNDSHAEGNVTTASALCSHAEGDRTIASGMYSHAQNKSTIAGYTSQTTIGKYNDNQSDTALEIGNGSADVRSNALTVDWDGNVWAAGAINGLVKHYGAITGATIADKNLSSGNSWQNIGSITLPDGAWLLYLTASFASNGTGYRLLAIADSSAAAGTIIRTNRQAPANGATTSVSINCPLAGGQTYYINGCQNSGTTLKVETRYTAIRIGESFSSYE